MPAAQLPNGTKTWDRVKGPEGDSLHVAMCAAGKNLRWLLKMIVKKGIGPFFANRRLLNAPGLSSTGCVLSSFTEQPAVFWRCSGCGLNFSGMNNSRTML